jgi:hypothetical protein
VRHIKLGDLVKPNPVLISVYDKNTTCIRLYTNESCNSWDLSMNPKDIGMIIGFESNPYQQSVIKVLFPFGIRWVHEVDTEVIQ